MYLKSRVKIPDVHGKLTRLRRGMLHNLQSKAEEED